MFEDVKFDLDFSENQAKKETPKIQVANKSKIESSISSKAGATQGTQKSIFSLNDLFGDDSEILDISLNFDKKNKEEKGSYGRKSTHSARDSHLRTGPSTDQQSKFYDSTRDSHLRAGTSRDQQSKSYDSTRESQLRAGSRVGSSRNQQSRYYDSIGDSANDKSFQEGIKRGIEKPPGNTPKRRFPGPAGLLPIESTEQAVPDLQCSQENADENYVWIKALDDQGMQWGDPDSLISKYNVGHIKQNKKPGTSIRMPILVARIKNLDKNCPDHICSLRDPNGEVGGSIHRDVIDQFGSEIQVGSILVLTNVIVLMTRTQYVNITLNNMVSIYRPYNVTHIRTVNWNDVEVTAEKKERVRQEQRKHIQGAFVASLSPAAVNN